MSSEVAAPPKKRSSRALGYLVILLLVAGVTVVAYYQDEVGYYFKLHEWDRAAPARTVAEFLAAGKRGDQQRADIYLGTREMKPLVKNGKWLGYSLTSNPGTVYMYMSELAPADGTPATNTEFIHALDGAAHVTMPDSKGKPVVYRLVMQGSVWKISEIRGGHP